MKSRQGRHESLVTVLIPVKNGMPFLPETIESVLRQTYKRIELIVSDDASIDGTTEYLSTLKDSRIKLVSPTNSLNAAEHWTFVSTFGKGDYVKLLCADDTLPKDAIARQVEILNSHSSVIAVASKRSVISASGRILIKRHGLAKLSGEVNDTDFFRSSIRNGTNVLGEPGAVMFRTARFKENLPWSNSIPYMLDFDFYCRALSNSKIYADQKVGLNFRVHGSSISAKQKTNHVEQFNQCLRLYNLTNGSCINLSLSDRILMKFNTQLKQNLRRMVFVYAAFLETFFSRNVRN
jgi:glycosyltransferase involved in cell wall biosynthesis